MTYSPDISDISTVIYSLRDIVDKCCTEYYVTLNVMCVMRSCGMCTWIYRYRCKNPKQTPGFF